MQDNAELAKQVDEEQSHIKVKDKPSPTPRTPEERENKWKALYQARYILANHGTMPERRLCRKQLKLMEREAKKAGNKI